MSRRRERSRHAERGAIAISTVLLFVALFGFFALAFNVGLIVDSRTELQNGADSAALAAARNLNGLASGLDAARQAAFAYSQRHLAYDQQITIDTGADVIFGTWHLRTGECTFGSSRNDCFEPLSVAEPRKITAVKILNGRDGGSHNSPLDLPFGTWVGTPTANVRSAAVAIGGGPGIPDCVLPLTIAECKIVDPGAGTLNCGNVPPMVFSDANADGIGFVNLYYPDDQQSPSGTWSANVINNRRCNPNHYSIGLAKVQNGDDFSKVNDALRGVDNQGNVVHDCLLNQPLSWAVTDEGCPGNPIFQGEQKVVGFVKATITAVTDNQGNALGCPGFAVDPIPGSPKNAMVVEIPCDVGAPGDFGGGRDYNTSSVRSRLVQ